MGFPWHDVRGFASLAPPARSSRGEEGRRSGVPSDVPYRAGMYFRNHFRDSVR